VKRWSVAGIVAVALAGCSGSTNTKIPYPNGPWSAGDQGTFLGSCDVEASDSYCRCALGSIMQDFPDTSNLPGSVLTGGTTAAEHKHDFPACAGK
jgi:hypothetical protein